MRAITYVLYAALIVFAQSASALVVERVTSVADDSGGSLSISSTSNAFSDGGSTETSLVASSFSPRGEGSISGELNRVRNRSAENLSSVYNGDFSIAGTDADGNPVSIDASLLDLGVVREGAGPSFSGTVIINGNSFAANEMPEPARRVVGRALRLFVFD